MKNNPETLKKYAEEHREEKRRKGREYMRRRRAAMTPDELEEVRRRDREYQQRNRVNNPGEHRRREHLRRHGCDYIQLWSEMWNAQEGKCYLCGDPMNPERAFLDHDHRCCPVRHSCPNCRRGLACEACNFLIGKAADDPERLRRIADNLEAALAVVDERMAAAPEQLRLIGGG